MAIPACVDPNACGTDVSFTTSGIKVDIVPNNVGCGVDLSCDTSGLRADARLLSGGGLLCDGPSRSLYVNRRGFPTPVDPSGACYSPVNLDLNGGMWIEPTKVSGDGVGDPPSIPIPALGDSSFKTFAATGNSFSVPVNGCPERWQGHCVAKINATADATPSGAWVTVLFRLDIAGVTHTVQDTRVTLAMSETSVGRDKANQYVWIPFIADANPGQIGVFNFSAQLIDRYNIDGAHTADNSLEFEGTQFTRMPRI